MLPYIRAHIVQFDMGSRVLTARPSHQHAALGFSTLTALTALAMRARSRSAPVLDVPTQSGVEARRLSPVISVRR